MSRSWVAPQVAGFLRTRLGKLLAAAFLYGSVATGHATAASDIDCFVVLRERLPGRAGQSLRHGFADLQRRLGFTPDLDYPLELFTIGECRAAAAGSTLGTALDRYAATGVADQALRESDDLEILRALTGPRLPLLGALVLEVLTDRAWAGVTAALAARPHLDPDEALPALGIPAVVSRSL